MAARMEHWMAVQKAHRWAEQKEPWKVGKKADHLVEQ